MTLAPGRRLGPYEVRSLIGSGATNAFGTGSTLAARTAWPSLGVGSRTGPRVGTACLGSW